MKPNAPADPASSRPDSSDGADMSVYDDQPLARTVEQALSEALHPIHPPAARQIALRQRLLERARASQGSPQRRVVQREQGLWQRLYPGVRVKLLDECAQLRSVLLEMEPGAKLPTHEHHAHEECVVLQGEIEIEGLRISEGDYHLAPSGSQHPTVFSRRGAVLFLRGICAHAEPPPLQDTPCAPEVSAEFLARALTVRRDEREWTEWAPGVHCKELWQHQDERSMLLRLQAGAHLPARFNLQDEECLMLEGRLYRDNALLRAGDYEVAPAGALAQHEGVSDLGALMFIHRRAPVTPSAEVTPA